MTKRLNMSSPSRERPKRRRHGTPRLEFTFLIACAVVICFVIGGIAANLPFGEWAAELFGGRRGAEERLPEQLLRCLTFVTQPLVLGEPPNAL